MKTSSQEVDPQAVVIDVTKEKVGPTVAHCLFAAGLYSASGIGIILINKLTLSGWKFPSPAFLAFLQLIVTTVIVGFLKFIKVVNFAPLSVTTAKNIFPLPIFFVGNALSSLGGTARLSVPTLGALRKLSIFMTMVLERVILQKKASAQVQSSVYLMVGGAFVAALEDLDFNLTGYLYILANDVFTAGNNVVTKQKTNQENLGAVGVLFYNALFSIPIAFIFAYPDFGLVLKYENWNNYTFQFLFFLSTVMGCMVTFSTIYCTKINSGLTTSVVGCLRNIVPVYLGMFSVFQYTFNWLHFIGLTISVCGAIAYSYIKWRESKPSAPKPTQTT